MRNVKRLLLAAPVVLSMLFSGGQSLAAAGPYPYCTLLNPDGGPAFKSVLDKKVTDPNEIVSQILDPVAPLKPEQLQEIYNQVFEFVITHYAYEDKLAVLEGYDHKYDGKLQTRADLDKAIDDLVAKMADRWTWSVSATKQVEHVLQALSKQVSFGTSLRLEKDGTFWVEHLDYASTAQLSGLREGDVIVSVNDKELKGLSKDEAEKLFVGPIGNSIKVKSIQDGKTVESSYILRAPAANDAGAKLLKNNVAYLKLPNFVSDGDFNKIIMSMVNMAAGTPGGLEGVILDLRYNGGGEVDKAKLLISFLLSKGMVIKEISRDGRSVIEQNTSILPLGPYSKLKFTADQLAVLKDLQSLPLVILVNGSSASASEIVTGALMESRPNTVVLGERSFGKFQEMLVTVLPNCTRVAVTSGRYTTPSGKWLQDAGITPDIIVHQPRDSQEDAQMAAAMELIEKKTGFNPSNIVQMSPETQPDFGPAPLRPAPSVDTDWAQVARENRVLIMQGGVATLLLGLLGLYVLMTGRKRDDE